MKLLDLFCGAGGAAMGYHQAGFDEIVGIDIMPQPNYPFEFIKADVLEFDGFAGFDLIHASPPCQIHSTLSSRLPDDHQHQDLIEATRQKLQASKAGDPLFGFTTHYVIENVPGAPLINPIQLCGSSFKLQVGDYDLRRHRLFECSFPILSTPCNHQVKVLGVYGDLAKNRRPSTRGMKAGIKDAETLMEIDWMTPKELVQAIPPAYTRYIGEQFLSQKVSR